MSEAVATAAKAAQGAEASGQASLAATIRAHQASYAAGRPLRE